MQRYLLFALAGVVIVWGCSEEYFPDAPVEDAPAPKPASKPAVSVTVSDPLENMTLADRKQALGGQEGATSYFELIAVQLAKTMNDSEVREIFLRNVPSWRAGEIKLADLAAQNPHFKEAVAAGFKDSLAAKTISGSLKQTVSGNASDETALLQVAMAMFDIEIVLANPVDEHWDGQTAIPVFYIPVDSDASNITGFDAALNPVSLPAATKDPPYPILCINFDEDRPQDSSSSYLPKRRLENEFFAALGNFLITPAWAHLPDGHDTCHDLRLVQFAKRIKITDDHEPGPNYPEIQIELYYKDNAINSHPRWDLPDVDDINVWYTDYDHLRAHGTCWEKFEKIQVWEEDVWSDDNVACWEKPFINVEATLNPSQADCNDEDAYLTVRITTETWD